MALMTTDHPVTFSLTDHAPYAEARQRVEDCRRQQEKMAETVTTRRAALDQAVQAETEALSTGHGWDQAHAATEKSAKALRDAEAQVERMADAVKLAEQRAAALKQEAMQQLRPALRAAHEPIVGRIFERLAELAPLLEQEADFRRAIYQQTGRWDSLGLHSFDFPELGRADDRNSAIARLRAEAEEHGYPV